jgi:hypothetical protein
VTALQILLSAVCLVAAVWLGVLIVRDRQPGDLLYATLGLLEVGSSRSW